MLFNVVKYAPIIEKARTSFWFVPSVMVFSSIILAVASVYFDASYINNSKLKIPLIYAIDVDAIRSLLGTIAGAMITVTSIAFSITIVALTLASSQFGPRLLRNFMMDPGTQVVLGAFISNFLYCILVFCAISFEAPYTFKPGLTVVIAVLMTCISVGVLIYFIHHVAKSIQADVVIDDVYEELQNAIQNLFPTNSKQQNFAENSALIEPDVSQRHTQLKVAAKCSGYVQTIDQQALVTLATKHNVLIECCLRPGDFIVKDAVIAVVHSNMAVPKTLINDAAGKIILGARRTPVQDPEFAIHQLVEIALRALSPGINDPYTAITCIDKLNAVLCGLTKRNFPSPQDFDQAGMLRLSCKVLTFRDIASAAFEQIRQQANRDVAVTIRLLDSLHNLIMEAQNDEHKHFVFSQTKMIEEQQNKLSLAEDDLKTINKRVASIYSVSK
ncbi:MAG: DUF2254 domain-containing protein [Paraglaciecola sp.]|uniref:DUF2254 domain-containing protein n=1 Tax=Paraglaciecola sp. TaxID=1920173 RepID=UPI003298F3A5